MKINTCIFKKNILPYCIILGCINAYFVNVFKVPFYILAFFIVMTLVVDFTLKIRNGLKELNLFLLVTMIGYLVYSLIAAMNCLDDKKWFLVHITSVIYLLWAYLITKNSRVNIRLISVVVFFYCIISLVIHFFFWEYYANIIYRMQYGHVLGLTTNGIPRCYGLLFNQLTNAYFLLSILFFTFRQNEKTFFGKIFIAVVIFTIILTLVRGAFVPLALFFFLYALYKRKVIYVFLMLLTLVIVSFTNKEIYEVFMTIITLNDSQGSAQAHNESVKYAIAKIPEAFFGFGFSNDVRLESWLLVQYLELGFFGASFLILILFQLVLKYIKEKKMYELIVFISLTPSMFIIPLNTFNLGFLSICYMLFYFYNNKFVEMKYLSDNSLRTSYSINHQC